MTNKNVDNAWEDPIVAKIHAFREAHAKRFNYDPEAMFQDLLKRQQEREAAGVEFISLPPKYIEKKKSGTRS